MGARDDPSGPGNPNKCMRGKMRIGIANPPMTSRPRRRQGELDVELTEERADEYFRLTGTPLPALEKAKELGEYIPPWKQEVRDEKGRRRLHGAFTGGFSAGYYNTVGSKEGWKPKAFVSSRSDRAERKVARPEDFMDEEDLAVLREEQDVLEKEEEMEVISAARAELNSRDSIMAGQQDFVSSARAVVSDDSVGARLLQRMGQRSDLSTNLQVPSSERVDRETRYASTSDISEKQKYSLRDITVLQADKKDNLHGLGYIPEKTPKESLTAKSSSAQGARLAVGFGLGALNDAEDDDLDVYDRPQDLGRTRLAYDASHPGPRENVVSAGKTVKGETRTSVQKATEGTPALAGFVPSEGRAMGEISYSASDTRRENEQSLNQGASSLGAALPGEISAPSSVFQYMSPKDRERLKAVTSQFPTRDRGFTESGANRLPEPATVMPFTEPHIAQAALRGFQPFAAEPAKQIRYHTYLQSQAFPNSESLTPLPHQKLDEFRKELDSYAKAAQLFKPMSGAMANRFTGAAILDQNTRVYEGLHKPTAADLARKEAPSVQKMEKKEESPKAQAARLGMYGVLTRESKPWQPARLLCKRFGVKDPNPEPEVKAAPSAPSSNTASMSSAPHSGTPVRPTITSNISTATSDQTASSKVDPREVAKNAVGEREDKSQDLSSQAQPPVDIYKTIFANDEEVSDDEARDSATLDNRDNDQPRGNPPATGTSIPGTGLPGRPAPSTSDKIDLSTFKPTFVPRSERDKNSKSKKDKKDKKKGGKAVLVSFELDEAGDSSRPVHQKSKDRPKKKRKHERDEVDEDEVMWTEKPPPEKKSTVIDSPPNPPPTDATPLGTTPPKGRKRAVDFM